MHCFNWRIMVQIQVVIMIYFCVGITVKLEQVTTNIKVILLSGVYDIPAKNLVCGFVGHNGQFACTRCIHPGKIVTTQKGLFFLYIYK